MARAMPEAEHGKWLMRGVFCYEPPRNTG